MSWPASKDPCFRRDDYIKGKNLTPDVGLFLETVAAHADDAEAVLARRLHHGPAFHLLHHRRTQFLESAHLGVDIVGFDVDVNPARMLYPLQDDVGIGRISLNVDVKSSGSEFTWLAAQRSAPKFRLASEIVGLTIDDQRAQSTFMHNSSPLLYRN